MSNKIRVFSDDLSLLNNKEPTTKYHKNVENVIGSNYIFEAPPHTIGSSNLTVNLNGRILLPAEFEDIGSSRIRIPTAKNGDNIYITWFRSGADYFETNKDASQWHHGSKDPTEDIGKTNDYYLNLETNILFHKYSTGWVSLGEKGLNPGSQVYGSGEIIYSKLARQLPFTVSFVETLEFKPSDVLQVFVNSKLLFKDYHFRVSGTNIVNFSPPVEGDIVIYKFGQKDFNSEWSEFNL